MATRPSFRRILRNVTINIGALAANPDDPPKDTATIWVSDGTGGGDDGDLMCKITNAAGTTVTGTILDYSAL